MNLINVKYWYVCFVESRTRKRSIKVEENEEDQSNYMSLDVLAQVASETLESEPKRNNKKVLNIFVLL